MTQLDTNPSSIDIGHAELIPVVIDLSDQMESGDILTSPSAALYDVTNGGYSAVSLSDAPYIQGTTQVVQKVHGSALTRAHRYRLEVTTTFQSAKILTSFLSINCP